MKQRTRYLVTCWVGAYALTAAAFINGGHMSALANGATVCAAGVLLFAAEKMVAKKGGTNE